MAPPKRGGRKERKNVPEGVAHNTVGNKQHTRPTQWTVLIEVVGG
jgi:hypothetical protein